MNKAYRIILVALLVIAPAVGFVVYDNLPEKSFPEIIAEKESEIVTNQQNQNRGEDVVTPENVLLSVPFFAQAPTANWSDPRQQDGCEEASLLMAHLWLTGKNMTVKEAEAEIIALSEYQNQKYGGYIDRSITDTGRLFEEYYGHSAYEIKRGIDAEDIKQELAQGNLVIIPTNGQILANPYYTGAGPITHMLPVIGYDDSTKEFITNDPGTGNGKSYKFKYDIVIDSIYEYETGDHVGYKKTDTVMMIVKKSS